jgi:penicillin V acylase-like amidase (Ntn superfamily)
MNPIMNNYSSIKSMLFTCILILLYSDNGIACSTCALVKGNNVLVCNNDDWFCNVAYLVINPRGVTKQTFLPSASKRIEWTSKYGSLTINFNFVGDPSGGMNEAGLVIDESWPGPCQYPSPDDRPEVDEIQWLQYQFDNCATVDEVIQTDSKLRIHGFFGKSHYFVCDKSGKAAAIEWIDGKMVVHILANENVPVLTNNNYDWSISELRKHEGFGGTEPIGITNSSLDRFCRAANMVQKFAGNDNTGAVDYGFTILENVSQRSTMFSWVYDITNRTINFKTVWSRETKIIKLDNFDFSSKGPILMADILTSKSGDISGNFEPYTPERHRDFVMRVIKSWRTNGFNNNVTDADVEKMIQYPETMRFGK